MSYGSQTRNPIEHDETPEDEDVKFCRGCSGLLPTPADAQHGNGWDWCIDCYAAEFGVGLELEARIDERSGK